MQEEKISKKAMQMEELDQLLKWFLRKYSQEAKQ